MNNFEVDARHIVNLFSQLNGKQQKQVYRSALRRAAGILYRETRSQLRLIVGKKINSKNRWNSKTLGSGIKYNANKEGTEAKVHILGDFRLKFFEKGTENRTTKKNAYRGSMKAHNFFDKSKRNKEREVFNTIDHLISQSIQKLAKK